MSQASHNLCYANLYQSFLLICNNFQSFLAICDDFYLWVTSNGRGPPISAHIQVQLQSISAQLRSEHATPVVAMQLRTPCATLITSKNPPPQHQPRYTHLAYLLYSPFPCLSGIYSCHP